jgi:TonB family protein
VGKAILFALATLAAWSQDWTPSKIVGISEYPRVARIARVEGSVTVKCTLDSAGKVAAAEVLSGPPLLRQFARENALQWTFQSVAKDVPSNSVILTYTFILEGEQQVQSNTTFTFEVPGTVRVTARPMIPLPD